MERDFDFNENIDEKRHNRQRKSKAKSKLNEKAKTVMKVGLLALGLTYAPIREPVINTGIMAGNILSASLQAVKASQLFNNGKTNSKAIETREEKAEKRTRPTYELIINSADIQQMAEFLGTKLKVVGTHSAAIPAKGLVSLIVPPKEFDAKSNANVFLTVDLTRCYIDGGQYSKTVYLDEPTEKDKLKDNDSGVILYAPPVKISAIEIEDFRITRKIDSLAFRIMPEDEEKAIKRYREELRENIEGDKEYYEFITDITYSHLEKALEELFGVNFSVLPIPKKALEEEREEQKEQKNQNEQNDKKEDSDMMKFESDLDKILVSVDSFKYAPQITTP